MGMAKNSKFMQHSTSQINPGGCPQRRGDRFVYTVLFFAAPYPEQPRRKVFVFSSLAAIYDLFPRDVVGCSLGHLYNLKVPSGSAYCGKRCIIKRERVFAKAHKCP